MTTGDGGRARVLLANPSGWQKESINLGLSYLASALIADDFDVLIIDLNRYEMDDASFLARARRYAPCLIGISIKTATAGEGGRLARLLADALPEAVIVAGGPHMTLCPESYMQENPAVAYGIRGEGEEAVVGLARMVREGGSAEGLRGVVWRQDGRLTLNEWPPPAYLDALRFPNLDVIEGFSWQGYRYPVLTSRGCPYGCTYCCVNKLTGSRKWRFRSPENVVEELASVVRAKGISAFEVWDDNFTLNLARAKEICRLLIERRLGLSWYCHNGIRADRIDGELARLMKEAGCTSIAFGIESGNPVTFASINKGEPLSAVVEAVRLVKAAGIKAVGYFIIGLPGDTLERFIETVRFQRSLKLDHYVFGMLIPYPHTQVWDIVQRQGTLFCDITETQHFSDDIVPISFELPSFPKSDMVRAYYVAKYFDLFDVTRQVGSQKHLTVVYLASPAMTSHLPGMFLACDPYVRHVVVGAEEASIRALPSFSQVPAALSISFSDTIPPLIPAGSQVTVCCNHPVPKEQLFLNSGLVLFDAQRPLHPVILVRLPVSPIPGVPRILLSAIGLCRALSRVLDVFGYPKLREVFLIQVVRPPKVRAGQLWSSCSRKVLAATAYMVQAARRAKRR